MGVISVSTAIPSELVLLCTAAPEPRSQQGWAGIWAMIREGAEVRGSGN